MAQFVFIADKILTLYLFILLVRILLTWIPNIDHYNPIVRFLYDVTEPVLRPIRNALPPMSGFDLSPLVVFFGIRILQSVLYSLV